MKRHVGILAALLAAGTALAERGEPEKGFTFYESFLGGANAIGLVSKLDTAAGYNFNKYFGVDVGIPVYFVRPSRLTTSFTGAGARNGLGNVYGDLRLSFPHPIVNVASTLTVTAPTGDKESGFSTGRPTVDWTSQFSRTFFRVTPFGSVGIANTISDTTFFLRPFSSLGFVTHVEGGAELRIAPSVSVGASAYKIAPSGEQRIVSRVGDSPRAAAGRGQASGRAGGRGRTPIETSLETTGVGDLVRDHGFSTWLSLRPASTLFFQVGYSRSVPFALDTAFFGVGLNIGSLARMARGH